VTLTRSHILITLRFGKPGIFFKSVLLQHGLHMGKVLYRKVKPVVLVPRIGSGRPIIIIILWFPL